MFNEQGNGLIIGILIGLVVATSLFGVYYFGTQRNSVPVSSQPPVQNTTPKPTFLPTPKPSAPTAASINNFPVYPDAIFVENRDYPPCTAGQYSGLSICNSKGYVWQVNSNYDLVSAFYKQDISKSGWKCSGGVGQYTSANEASGVTSCTKGNTSYDLHINTTNGVTTIILPIPQGSPTGN